VLEHFAVLKERKSMLNRLLFGNRLTPLTAFFVVFTGVFLLVVGTATLVTFILPEVFASTARIRIERDSNDAQPQSDSRQVQSSYDPYFIQTEFEVIQSELILGRVIETLNLNAEWARKYSGGEKLKIAETLDLLRRCLDLKPVRNTSLIEIRVLRDRPEEAAKIANAIAETYRAYRLEQERQMNLAKITALEERWNEKNHRQQVAQEEFVQLRGKLQVPTPEPAEGELLAKYPSYVEAKQRLEELRQSHTVLGMKIAQEETDLSLPRKSPVEIIDRAYPGFRPVRPNKPLNVMLGALLGIALGSVAGAGTAGLSFLAGRNSRNKAVVS
jgi:uncharacterized protein involved in exopolysaccharide biosynthesis